MTNTRYEVNESQGTIKGAGHEVQGTQKGGGSKPLPAASNKWAKDQPAPVAAVRLLHAAFHQAKNGGIYVPRTVGTTSIPSGHAEGRALDLQLSVHAPAEKILGDAIFKMIIESASSWGIDHVIWDRHIWSREKPFVHDFVGVYTKHGQPMKDAHGRTVPKNPHTDHLHIEWTREGSQHQRLLCIQMKIGQLKSDVEDLGVYSDSRGVL